MYAFMGTGQRVDEHPAATTISSNAVVIVFICSAWRLNFGELASRRLEALLAVLLHVSVTCNELTHDPHASDAEAWDKADESEKPEWTEGDD